MRLLVTGGAGFIGSNFILYWLNRHPHDRIINLDALTYAGNLANLESVETSPNYSFVHGDITDQRLVESIMQGIDKVVHFAAESHVDRSIVDPAIFVKTNILGTQILLDAALKNKIKRFHHVSTDEVFGTLSLNDKDKFCETTSYNPRSPYAASKAGADHLVRAYFHTFSLPVTITNCSNNFGPFQYPEKLVALTITNILEEKKVPVYGDGLYVRDWLYVKDHCRAIELVLEKGQIGETYCIGGLAYDMSNIDIIRKILKIMEKDESYIEFVKDRPGHDRKYAIDWTKIKTELGWQPAADFDTYLLETINWYKLHRDWWIRIKENDRKKYNLHHKNK